MTEQKFTASRADILNKIADGPEIFEYIEKSSQKRHIFLASLADDIKSWQENNERFLKKVYSGTQCDLPPRSLSGLAINNLRTVQPLSTSISQLEMVLAFDTENRLLVDYIINNQENLETWAKKNIPKAQGTELRAHLDSYLLEHFGKKGLVLGEDSKLYLDPKGKPEPRTQDKPLTPESYSQYLDEDEQKRLKKQIQDAELAENVELTYQTPDDAESRLDNMLA